MSQDQIAKFFAIVSRLVLTDEEVAAVCGISVHTARLMRASGQAPRSQRCQLAIAAFIDRNSLAQCRGDVRLNEKRASA